MISGAAATVVTAAAVTLKEVHAMTADMIGLLRAWISAPEPTAARINRAAWLLDGWDRIALLWREATWPASQRAALLEMAQLVPTLPQELADWTGRHADAGDPTAECRVISLSEAWRTGSASFGLVARNERIRAGHV
jgi:hypothetical protein